MGVSLFTGTIFCLPKSNQTIMCGPEEALAASNKCGQLSLSHGAWTLCCRNPLIRESQASFSQCLGGAYTRAKPRTQLMKTANRCSSLCRKAWRWRPQLSLYQCKQCQVQWLHATGQFPQQVLEQLSLPRQKLWHRQSFRWWKHPSKPQAVGSARAFLWHQERWLFVLQKVCHLGRAVPSSGGAMGGSEQSAQHQRVWKGDRQISSLRRNTLKSPGPQRLVRCRQHPPLV